MLKSEEIARIAGIPFKSGFVISSFSTDSRTVKPGALFFAIKGEKTDGHFFVKDALSKGAIAAVVERDVECDRAIKVKNTIAFLQNLAAWYRKKLNSTVVGITGSVGKTTTKELIKIILEVYGGKASPGNINTQIGLPIVILSQKVPGPRFLVLEMGISMPGEMERLTNFVKPHIGIITKIGRTHLEFLKTEKAVAEEKSKLIECLPADGLAILNKDDKWFELLKNKTRVNVVSIGIKNGDIRAEIMETGPWGSVFKIEGVKFKTSIPGDGIIYACLFAAALVKALGLNLKIASETVSRFKAPPGRMRVKKVNNVLIIDDTYNANPESVKNAVKVLAQWQGEKIFCFGDMLELGESSEELHAEIGQFCYESGIDHLLTWGKLAKEASKRFESLGKNAKHFDSKNEMAKFLKALLKKCRAPAVLVKGSRGSKMEEVIELCFTIYSTR